MRNLFQLLGIRIFFTCNSGISDHEVPPFCVNPLTVAEGT